MKRALVVLMLISLGSGWILYLREHNNLIDYKQQQEATDALRQVAATQTSAIFEKIDGSTMYFKTPVQTTTAAGTFVNYQEQIGTIDDSTVIINIAGSANATALEVLAPGSHLSLELAADPSHPGQSLIKTVYITQ